MKRTPETNNILEEVHDYCIDFTNRQIYLHDSVKEEEDGIDFRVASRFIKNMAILEPSGEPIVVHQMSHGGYVDAGFAIYDCIKTSNCYVSIVCHGYTMSMASIILQAADERIAMPNCLFMFHEGGSYLDGTHKNVQSWANIGRKLNDKTIDIYVERCQESKVFEGKTLRQIRNYITSNFDKKEDWILTAEEALHHGFIDRILGEKELKLFVQRP